MSSRGYNPAKARNSKLAAIHAEKKSAGLDDETYRSLLERVTGHRSAKDCSDRQLVDVLSEMRRLAGKPLQAHHAAKVWAGKPKDMTPLLRKVEALLADAGREWAYGHALAERMFKVKRLEWLNPDQLHRAVSALQLDADRRQKRGN